MAGAQSLECWARRFAHAGRLTLNFHPDRVSRDVSTVAARLLTEGRYRSQWITGISGGSRSAIPGAERYGFESEFFGGAYDDVDPSSKEHPVYGALDLLFDDHGGSPRFGSSTVVLLPRVRERTTMCLGDSHMAPGDVGAFDAPWSILAGLAEQAARGQLLNRSLGTDILLQALAGTYRLGRASRDLDGYVEAQVHGGVSLANDVEAIVLDPSFRATPVARDLEAAAQRYGFDLKWHHGSELHVDEFPDNFRGPMIPALARRIARPDGLVDAYAIRVDAARVVFEEPTQFGDPPESALQQVKYMWHTLLAHGHDAVEA